MDFGQIRTGLCTVELRWPSGGIIEVFCTTCSSCFRWNIEITPVWLLRAVRPEMKRLFCSLWLGPELTCPSRTRVKAERRSFDTRHRSTERQTRHLHSVVLLSNYLIRWQKTLGRFYFFSLKPKKGEVVEFNNFLCVNYTLKLKLKVEGADPPPYSSPYRGL